MKLLPPYPFGCYPNRSQPYLCELPLGMDTSTPLPSTSASLEDQKDDRSVHNNTIGLKGCPARTSSPIPFVSRSKSLATQYIYLHIYEYTNMYTHICALIHMHSYMCTHICVYINEYTYLFFCIHGCRMSPRCTKSSHQAT